MFFVHAFLVFLGFILSHFSCLGMYIHDLCEVAKREMKEKNDGDLARGSEQ